MKLDNLLKEAVSRGASDIHLAPGNPAMIRLNTRLMVLNDTILSSADTENMALRILGNDGFAQLQEIGEVDTSYRMPGVANFRVNVYRYQGMIGIAARVIRTIIPDLESLGLPPVGGLPGSLSQRSYTGNRPHRQRKIYYFSGIDRYY